MNSEQKNIEKIEHIMRCIIVSEEFDVAYNGILLCNEKNAIYTKPFGCLLLSKGGLGKTTLCKAIVKKHPKYIKTENNINKTIIPVFYIEIPSPATVKSVASSMLKALNDPAPFSGTTGQLNHRLVTLLKACETKLIFMDEFHHLFDLQTSTKRMNTVVCNWIKTLINETTDICFCLVGLPEFESLLKMDTQLARRFPYSFTLNPLQIKKYDEFSTLHAFLLQIEKNVETKLDIRFEPALSNKLLAMQIYIATSGNHAYLMLLIENCLLQAMNNNKKIITTEFFSKAWETGVTAFVCKISTNPFTLDLAEISSRIRGN